MNQFLILLSVSDGFQILEKSKSELALESVEYMILYFGLSLAMITMMLIPVILFSSMVLNYFSMNDYYKKLSRAMNFQGNNKRSEYLKSLKLKYVRSSSSFFKYFAAITTWNVFSLIYILVGFDSFFVGVKEYLLFPLNVFQNLNETEIYNTIHVFQNEGLSMAVIIALTFIFYIVGKYSGVSIAKNKISTVRTKVSMTKDKIRKERLKLAMN